MGLMMLEVSNLSNPLASVEQLEMSASGLDGVPRELEYAIRFESARLVQAAGNLLRLNQETIAQAIVILYRFWTGSDGGSLLEHDTWDVIAAALYLTAKPSGDAVGPRRVLTVIDYLSHVGPGYDTKLLEAHEIDSHWNFSDGQYEERRQRLYDSEAHILRVLGFEIRVALPYRLCINYLQALDVFRSPDGPAVAKRAVMHLNSALLSPQLLHLTHQPTALATAAVYLSAREIGVTLPEVDWWEVFDVDREELGFLVVAFQSVKNYARDACEIWNQRKVPLTVAEVQKEITRLGKHVEVAPA